MPVPLAPIAGFALRYGAVALIGATIAKRSLKTKAEKDVYKETVMDAVPNGAEAHRIDEEEGVQLEGSHGHRQRIWIGNRGIEFDSRILARLRIRKIRGDIKK